MKRLLAIAVLTLILAQAFATLSTARAASNATIEFKQPTYAYKGQTKQIEVKVTNTGTETINNLWLGLDLVHKVTIDNEENEFAYSAFGTWQVLYSFTFSDVYDKATVQVKEKFVRSAFGDGGQAALRAYWTPTGGSETQKSSDIVVSDSETTYVVKDLLVNSVFGATGTLTIKAFVQSLSSIFGTRLDTDWAVVSAEKRVEATKTPIKPDGASDFGGFNFGSQQGLALAPGAARTFTTSYTFSRSSAYSYDYDYGAYYWDMAVWKDGYPGQGGETGVARAQKPFTIPYQFDMTVSIEWNIDPADTSYKGPSFVNQLVNGLREASNFFFGATEGQMCFSKISIYDNKEHWQDATLQVHEETVGNSPSDVAWPKTGPSFDWSWPPVTTTISMGRQWTYNGLAEYDSFDSPMAYKTMIHEFGHLKLGLQDEYMTDPISHSLDDIAKMWLGISVGEASCESIMYHQWEYNEFCNPVNHHEDTWQEATNHESCYSTIKEKYPWLYIPMQVNTGPYDGVGKDVSFVLGGRSGGPDYFGYTYLDSNSLIGPAISWTEISGTGTEVLPSSDDQWVGNINLGFFFNYYGADYTLLAIGNNGLLFSGTGTSQYVNDPITQSPTIHGFIAPYWDDLVTWGSAGSIYYKTIGASPNRKFVVEWYDNQHYYSSSSGITFEAILYEGSNNILFQYQYVDFGTVSGSTSRDLPPFNNGGSATVGIEDPTGSIDLQYSFDEQVINPGLAILFKFPSFAGTNVHLSMNAPVSIDHGNTMTYTFYYNNLGDVAAPSVVLQATLSANLDFVSASDSGIYDPATRTVTWNLGPVLAFPTGRGSTTISATIPASVPVGTVIQTTSSISTTVLETRYDDNSASAQTTVTGSNLPPNVGVGPTLGNTGGTPSVYWGTPITFTYHDATATGVDIKIHLDDGGSDIIGSMTGGPPDWTYTVAFYPRHGHATVTYTVHGPTPQSVVFNIYVDPAGYVYDVNTLSRVAGANVWLQIPDGQGGWENAPTGQSPPTMQPDTNPLVTGTDGQFQWDVLEGTYRLHVEAPGYYPADSIIVTVPPPVTDLHIGLTPLPVPQYQITFDQTGVGSDLTGTIVIIDGTNYTASDLPAVFSWDQGSVHNFSFASPLSVNSGKEYVWTGTTGLSSVQSGSLNVTTDRTIVGNYKTQYYLTVQTSPTDVNSPAGEGWYDASSSAPISTEQYVDVADSLRYRFNGWITSNIAEITNSTSPSTTILMDEAKTVTANYVTQYNTTFDQTGVGSDFISTVVTIDGTSYGVSTLPAAFWWDNGSTHTFAFQSPLIVGSGAKQCDWTFTSGLSQSQSDSITITGAGSVTGNYVTRVHDVAVTSVLPVVPHCSSKVGNDSWVFQGRPVYVNVTISNNGDFDENVTVTLYYNSTTGNSAKGINSPNILLSAGQSQTIVLLWNTTATPYCLNYTITAVATIHLDNNPADNTRACGPINVRIMGDINGDGKVDGKDIVAVAMSFPSWGPDFLCPGSPPGPRWNLDCDINCDNRIDGKDLVLTALNFGK